MTLAYFRPTDAGLLPHPESHAPWGEDMLHGRLLGGLTVRALEQAFGRPGWRAARLTVDLFRPSAMAPVSVQVDPVRQGRRVVVADAVASCEGHEVCRVTGVFLPESEEPPGRIWRPDDEPWPDPDDVPPADSPRPEADQTWLIRPVDGGMDTGQRSRLWTNDTGQLVEGEEMSPLVRAAVSGDLACPMTNSSDQGIHYINADYTLFLGRYPVGPWVGLASTVHLAADGIAVASATLVDRDGPFATSTGASLARPPLPR